MTLSKQKKNTLSKDQYLSNLKKIIKIGQAISEKLRAPNFYKKGEKTERKQKGILLKTENLIKYISYCVGQFSLIIYLKLKASNNCVEIMTLAFYIISEMYDFPV